MYSQAWSLDHTKFLLATCRLFRFGFWEPRASLVAQRVKNLPAVQETQVWSLGWEDPLEEGMATHSSILAWRIPWAEEPGELQSIGLQRVRHNWVTFTFTFHFFTLGADSLYLLLAEATTSCLDILPSLSPPKVEHYIPVSTLFQGFTRLQVLSLRKLFFTWIFTPNPFVLMVNTFLWLDM